MRDESIEIKLIQNTKNLGVSSSRHKAILSSTSDFISTLDGDDTISPLKIDMEMKAIVKMGCEVAFSDIKVLTSTTTRILNTRGYHQKPVESILNNLLTRSVPVPRDLTFSRKIYDKAGGFEPSFNLYEDWMLKQRMAVLSGEKSWAHSGVIGTTYDRRNPGLSNKHAIQLCYAQLLVLVKNISYFKNFDIDFAAVMRTLFHRAPELEKIFIHSKIINLDKQSYNEYVFNRLFNMSLSLDDLPSYSSDPDVIVKEFSKI